MAGFVREPVPLAHDQCGGKAHAPAALPRNQLANASAYIHGRLASLGHLVIDPRACAPQMDIDHYTKRPTNEDESN